MRVVPMALATGAIAVTSAASAEPLKPTDTWHLYYTPSSCAAERRFGEYVLGLEEPPLGDTMRLIVTGPGRSASTRQLDSLLELADGGPPIKTSSLVYGTSRKGYRGITTLLAADQAVRVSKSMSLKISTLGRNPRSKSDTPGNDPVMSIEFAIGSTGALSREIAKCMEDLRQHWGMVNGELPTPATPADFTLRGLFRSSDYPRDAMHGGQGGDTTFMVMIDEKGAIMDCMVEQSSGVASLDAMACQIIRTRAKAKKPALDAAGKPVKSIMTETVTWQLIE
jgi:TonB family protein